MKILSTARQYRRLGMGLDPTSIEFQAVPPSGQGFSSNELAEIAEFSEVVIVGDDECDSSFFEKSPDLRLLIRWGAGSDNVDFEAAKKADVQVFNTPGLFGEDVTDMALGLALALIRKISETDSKIKSGFWPKESTTSMRELSYAVLGFGTVGKEIAKALSIFSDSVKAYDPFVQGESTGASVDLTDSLEHAVDGVNMIFLALPLTKLTLELVDENLVRKMSAPRYIINVSRGQVMDEPNIFRLLDDGTIEGLGLDVFHEEPVELRRLPKNLSRVVLSSHNASNTRRSIGLANRQVDQIIANYLDSQVGH